MTRAIDVCTCGCPRSAHNSVVRTPMGRSEDACDRCSCNWFMPTPQPGAVPTKTVEDRVVDFLGGLGEVHATLAKGGLVLKTLEGEVWEVQVFKRSAGSTANPEGV